MRRQGGDIVPKLLLAIGLAGVLTAAAVAGSVLLRQMKPARVLTPDEQMAAVQACAAAGWDAVPRFDGARVIGVDCITRKRGTVQ